MAYGTPTTTCANHPTTPASQLCERCGDFVCAACVQTTPLGQSYCHKCYDRSLGGLSAVEGVVPFEDREALGGLLPALWKTVIGIFSPSTFFQKIGAHGDYGPPLLYILICTYIGTLGAMAFQAVGIAINTTTDFSDIVPGFGTTEQLMLVGGVALLMPLVVTPLFFIWAGFMHIGCMLAGADAGGFRGTFRGLAYTSGLQFMLGLFGALLSAIALASFVEPGLYSVLGFVDQGVGFITNLFSLVLTFFAIRDVHQATTGRAILAVVIPFGAILVLTCGCVFAAGGLAAL